MREADAIIPIPLHRFRLMHRKFNQSALLASRIAKAVPALPYKHNLLIRRHYTPPQVSLNYDERKDNVKDVFAISARYASWLKDKHIIIVDDVLTTGATVESATKTLKDGGAARVSVILCAKRII
jgi:ComF family protein